MTPEERADLRKHVECASLGPGPFNAKTILPLFDEIDRLTQELADHDASFEIRWQASVRAIKRWKKETGETKFWPSHEDLCVWLLRENRKLQANLDRCYGSSPSIYMEMCQNLVERDEKISALEEENKRFRAFIENNVLNYDPRSDVYATELQGDAHEALGRCRCCGQKDCDDTDGNEDE